MIHRYFNYINFSTLYPLLPKHLTYNSGLPMVRCMSGFFFHTFGIKLLHINLIVFSSYTQNNKEIN